MPLCIPDAPTAEAAQYETTSTVSLDKVNQMTPTQTASLEIARQMKHTENERKKRQFGFMPGLGGGASMANSASWSFGVPGMPFGASFSMSNSMSGFGK